MLDWCGWGLGVWNYIQHQPWLDRTLLPSRFCAQIEISASRRSHLCPRVPRQVWNYLLTVSEVLYDTQTMPDWCGWGLRVWHHLQHQPWFDRTLPRNLSLNWNLSLLKVTFMSKGAQEGMELPDHCSRSVIRYTNYAWLVWLRSGGMELHPTSTLIG